MISGTLARSLLILSALAACSEANPPTAPVTGGPASHHASGHLVVNSLADPGDGTCNAVECTLREAITVANQDPDGSEISFAQKVDGAITLNAASGQLDVSEDVVISGPRGGIVIQRSGAGPEFRIFEVFKSGGHPVARLTRLIVRGGATASDGGGIRNVGDLTLTNCIVSGNSALGGGGGIANAAGGNLTLISSTVSGNSATTLGGGGIAALNPLGNVTLINSTISGNQVTGSSEPGGGGISYAGVLTLTGSTVSGNSSSLAGGGIANIAGGGFLGTSAVLTNSTVSGNSAATVGGGINTTGTGASLTLTNTTVVSNSAASQGGGVNHDASGSMFPSTLTNALVARNTAPTAPDLFGTFSVGTARFNLIGIGNGSSGVSDGVDGNQVGTSSAPLDPRLGALVNNGGPTKTHALKLGSRAIDAASTPEGPTTDQRGVLRPQGLASDIGSYERKAR